MQKLLFILSCVAVSWCAPAASPYEKNRPVELRNAVDRAFAAAWGKDAATPPPCEASDAVLVRRLCLGIASRLPAIEEARNFRRDADPKKFEKLLDKLLAEKAFVDYFAMFYCDRLRIKSEFPINLWPNAVYGYARRVQNFIARDEPVTHFLAALATGSGSNFRSFESNFYRAVPEHTPEGTAEFASLVFYDCDFRKLPERTRRDFARVFAGLRRKKTLEWKEEVVWGESAARDETFQLPSGKKFTCKKNEDPRAALAEALKRDPACLRAQIRFLAHILYGDEPIPDAVADAVLAEVGANFTVRQAVRSLALAAPFRITPTGDGKNFRSFPVRRLEAEVLDDLLCDITGKIRSYASVIPEPFTYLPGGRRTVAIEDGSITNSFLILFGRPARDSGVWSERDNRITAKQRLYLFNSGELYRALERVRPTRDYPRLPFPKKLELLYERFYSRPPEPAEAAAAVKAHDALKNSRDRWFFQRDLVWILVNSKEFLYRH